MADQGIAGLRPHPAQSGLLAARTGNRHINSTCAYQVTGPLDPARLAQAYEQALRSFDALHLAWSGHGTGGRWVVTDAPRVQVGYADLRGEHPFSEQATGDLLQRVQELASRPFNLGQGPAGRVNIWRAGSQSWVVAETFDHALADGRSLSLLHDAVGFLYPGPTRTARRRPAYASVLDGGPPSPLSLRYWREAFDRFDPAPLPPLAAGQPAADWHLTLPTGTISRLEQAAGRLRGTLASAILTAHAHALARHCGTGDIATYVAVDTRTADQLDLFGQMTAVLPLRVRHGWPATLGHQVSAVTRGMLQLREHADVGVETLDDLSVPVSLSRPDATAFVMQPYSTAPNLHGTDTTVLPLHSDDQAGGLATIARSQPDGSIRLSLRAAPGSHFAGMITSIGETLNATLEAITSHPEITLGDDALLPARCRPVIEATARPSAPYPFQPVAEGILARLSSLGSREILIDDRTYSAADLLHRILETANHLREAGTCEGDTVMAGSLPLADRIAAFAAALHLGAVYMPFGPRPPAPGDVPQHADATLIDKTGIRRCPGPRVTAHSTGPAVPAYVIFTSGSSGTPKGVIVGHASLSNLISGEADRFGICTGSRVLLIAPPTTDPWICHVTAALTFGATLIAGQVTSGPTLGQQMRTARITHAFLPAGLLRTLDTRDLPDLQMIATAGDTCRAADLAGFGDAKVFNIYGPTEATVTATVAEITGPADPVPIGRPIRGLGARTVIDRAATAPPGAPGELIISGAGVADGYLSSEEPAPSPFRDDPFSPGQRCYCTGDLARLETDGQLVHLGRIDRQVKIRGTRVELEAVEAAARATGLCADARAKTYRLPSSPDALLVLFAEGCPAADVKALSQGLRERIPAAAQPHHITAIRALPRRPSGKVADELLPDSYPQALSTAPTVIPRGSTRALSRIWAQVLGAAPGPADRFFDMGGDSLNVLRFIRAVREAGIDLDPADVYAHPEFTDLDQLCRARRPDPRAASPSSAADNIPLGPAQEWLLSMGVPDLRPWTQHHTITFPRLPSLQRLQDALTALTEVTPILRASLDAENHRFTFAPSDPVRVEPVTTGVPDQTLRTHISALAHTIDPGTGAMLTALAVRGEHDDGVLVLAAHHLVVDTWSWSVIEDRLRVLLSTPRHRGKLLPPDHGFAQYARAVARQRDAGAFDLETKWWTKIIAAGDTAELTGRPATTQQARRRITDPARSAGRQPQPASRILLAALGAALHATYGRGVTGVDLERNGRASISGLDLSGSAGWIGLHHPVALIHAPLTPDAIQRIRSSVDDIPDFGLGYGALRWSGRSDFGDHVGRFAVNVSGPSAPEPDTSLERRISALAEPGITARNLPYHGTFTFGRDSEGPSVSLDFDPAQVSRGEAEHLVAAVAEAAMRSQPSHRPRGKATRRCPALSWEPVPANAMQRMMLHYAGSTPGAYLPRQVLAIDSISDADRFLDTLGGFLGQLDPFQRRFRTARDGIAQTWLPAGRAVPVHRGAGGHRAALDWIDSDDRITSEAVLHGDPPAQLTAFCDGGTVFLGMEMHHALMDGVSNTQLLSLINQLARQFLQGAPTIPTHHGLASRTVLRKHVACEIAAHGRISTPEPPATTAATHPVARVTEIPPSRMQAISNWATGHGADLRAALAAITAQAARETHGARAMYIVTNGRDADIPGSADALGMFWYFSEIQPLSEDTAHLAKVIHQAGAPVNRIRSAALHWPQWDTSGVAFNFTKQTMSSGQYSHLRVIRSRDTYHFSAQVSAVAKMDGSVVITSTATRKTTRLPPFHARTLDIINDVGKPGQ